jgi:hydroxymethylbilane synthase
VNLRPITVATRRSTLALAQTRAFVRALIEANPGLLVEELLVVTSGDKIQDRPLYEAGGKGLFVKEIEEALLAKKADFAVHSMKDLPAQVPAGLTIACIPERADPRDTLLVRPDREPKLDALPKGAKVGSSSLRRKLALSRLRPDLEVIPLRGNIDTRMKKLVAGDYDAIVLAAAGLSRLGVDVTTLPPHAPMPIGTMLPAVAQGILAIEARDGDDEVKQVLAPLDHAASRLMATAERGVLEALDADCTVPLAAHVSLSVGEKGETMRLDAWLAEADGTRLRSTSQTWNDLAPHSARDRGQRVGQVLRYRGAAFKHPVLFQIAQILLEEWDPIGIRHQPGAQTEYDSYVPIVGGLIVQKASVEQIIDLLFDVETRAMSRQIERERLRPVAEKILALGTTKT